MAQTISHIDMNNYQYNVKLQLSQNGGNTTQQYHKVGLNAYPWQGLSQKSDTLHITEILQ